MKANDAKKIEKLMESDKQAKKKITEFEEILANVDGLDQRVRLGKEGGQRLAAQGLARMPQNAFQGGIDEQQPGIGAHDRNQGGQHVQRRPVALGICLGMGRA